MGPTITIDPGRADSALKDMFYDTESIKLYNENCLSTMEGMQENSIDSIITDPPYGLGKEPDALEMLKAWVDGETKTVNGSGFMGKKWDAFVPQPEIWKAAYRVLKPGGYLLSFFGTRTFDWGVMSIRLGGFEIRESIAWLHSQGFPKNQNISKKMDAMAGADREIIGYKKLNENDKKAYTPKADSVFSKAKARDITAPATKQAKQWHGWGTALKPAMELIVVARKPLSEKTVAKNVLKWGTGGINIEECRVEIEKTDKNLRLNAPNHNFNYDNSMFQLSRNQSKRAFQDMGFHSSQGRWPANVIHDGSDEVRRGFPERNGELHNKLTMGNSHFVPGLEKSKRGYSFKDTGSASRFYYQAKCSKQDRDEGLTGFPLGESPASARSKPAEGRKNALGEPRQNSHPTVKPTKLMQYLCKLVTQTGGTIYDPFMGSGSTGKAALLERFKFIGSEINQEYCEIAKARIIWASKQYKQMTLFENLRN